MRATGSCTAHCVDPAALTDCITCDIISSYCKNFCHAPLHVNIFRHHCTCIALHNMLALELAAICFTVFYYITSAIKIGVEQQR
eukprot:14616-Heterococcus_DN1.PRE.11